MKKKLVVAVIVSLLITLCLQTYMLFQLNSQIYLLTGQINQTESSRLTFSKMPAFTPAQPACENPFPKSHTESL